MICAIHCRALVEQSKFWKEELGSASDNTVREMVGILKRGVEYSNEILAELSDYSREIKLDLTKTSLKSILNKSLELVEKTRECKHRGLE